MTALLFPGQGSQRHGMGAGLFERYPDVVAEADRILGYSVRDLCLAPSEPRLHQTEFTQPAIYVTTYLRYRDWAAQGASPQMLAGHSLGEYTALTAAGVFSFATGLQLVQRRGILMGNNRGGGLVAVLGIDADTVARMIEEERLGGLEIANINSPDQVVVGGMKNRLQDLLDYCSERAIRAVPLKVSGAFHTSHMKEAAEEFSASVDKIHFSQPAIPVLSSVTGNVHVTAGIGERLVVQMYQTVRWSQCVQTMLESGIDDFKEIGSPAVLLPFVMAVKKSRVSSGTEVHSPEPYATGRPTVPSNVGFCETFRCARPIIAGALGRGMSNAALVAALAKSRILAFLDTEGLSLDQIDQALSSLSCEWKGRFGIGVTADPEFPNADAAILEMGTRHGVHFVEARGYVEPSRALRLYHQSTGNRLVVRVATYNAASAFLGGSREVARAGNLPEPGSSIAADAICVDLHGWRGTPGGCRQLLVDLLNWRNSRSKVDRTLFVGATPAMISPGNIEAILLSGADFVCAGSAYLAARETNLDENTRSRLRRGQGAYEELPDWHWPELDTHSWTFISEPRMSNAVLKLRALYMEPPPPEEWDPATADIAEPLRSMVRRAVAGVAHTADTRTLRAALAKVGRSIPLSFAVPCDAPLAPIPESIYGHTEGGTTSGPSAAHISEFLFSLDHFSAHSKEVANA